jgi:hypothetical protein
MPIVNKRVRCTPPCLCCCTVPEKTDHNASTQSRAQPQPSQLLPLMTALIVLTAACCHHAVSQPSHSVSLRKLSVPAALQAGVCTGHNTPMAAAMPPGLLPSRDTCMGALCSCAPQAMLDKDRPPRHPQEKSAQLAALEAWLTPSLCVFAYTSGNPTSLQLAAAQRDHAASKF